MIDKASAIEAIKINSLQPPENGKQYEAVPRATRRASSSLLLRDDATGAVYVGTKKGLTPLAKSDVTISPDTSQPTAAKGYTLIKGAELFTLDKELAALRIPTHGDAAIQAQGVAQAVELQPTLRYDAREEPVRADQRRRRLHRQRPRLVRQRQATSSSLAGRRISASTTSASSRPTRCTATRS